MKTRNFIKAAAKQGIFFDLAESKNIRSQFYRYTDEKYTYSLLSQNGEVAYIIRSVIKGSHNRYMFHNETIKEIISSIVSNQKSFNIENETNKSVQ